MEKTEKEHKTISSDDVKNYPVFEKNNPLPAVFRKKRHDLWISRDIMIEHFKKNF